MINKWQIDMERSLRFNTLFFYRTPGLLLLLLLFPVLVQATESVYEQQIQQEYAWVEPELYAVKRKEVLQHFYQTQPLYQTEYFQQNFELQAKQNLNRVQ